MASARTPDGGDRFGGDRLGAALRLDTPGPEERLPPAVRAWLDPRSPLPPGVRLIPVRKSRPFVGILLAALLLGAAAGAVGVMGAHAAAADQASGAWTSAFLAVALVSASFFCARAAAQRLGARLTGGRRARTGLLFGDVAGEAVLLLRLRSGEALLVRRSCVLDADIDEGGDVRPPRLRIWVGAERAEARAIVVDGDPAGGEDAALATLRAWRKAHPEPAQQGAPSVPG